MAFVKPGMENLLVERVEEGGTCSGSEEPCSPGLGFFQYSGFFFLQGSHFITKFQTISHGIGISGIKDQERV